MRRILCSQRINLFHHWFNAELLSALTDDHSRLVHVLHLVFQPGGTCYLEIGETVYFRLQQELRSKLVAQLPMQFLVDVNNMLEFLQEPLVDLGELVNLVDGISLVHRLGDDEDTLVGRLPQSTVDILDVQLFVRHEAMHALSDHTQTLLDGLLEGTTDGHHLSYRLHATAQLLIHTMELGEIPTRNLTYHVVESRLKESRGGLGNRVVQLEQTIAHT